jgi:hypothetical protein
MRLSTILAVGVTILLLGGGTWFFFLRAPAAVPEVTSTTTFPSGTTQTVGVDVPTTAGTETNTTINTQTPLNTTGAITPIFKIGNGPIIGATIIQTLRPTTTVARYVQQQNGHIFDITLDSSGAVPRSVSNTTIPGIVRALWTDQGNGVLLQYLDNATIKTVHLGFPAGQSTTTRPVLIKFLPDGIVDIAVSPNGASVVYLLKGASSVVGYTAKSDGTGSKQLFTIPLKEVLISWPSPGTLLAQSKSAPGAAGIAFSINASSGVVLPLLHAPGLTLIANPTFAHVVYNTGNTTYAREVSSGKSFELTYTPYPEKCVWGVAISTYLYCAAPLSYTGDSYLPLWHKGYGAAVDALLAFDMRTGDDAILAVPGSEEDGGVESTVHTMTISSDGRYLLFIRRGDYSLWGLRL